MIMKKNNFFVAENYEQFTRGGKPFKTLDIGKLRRDNLNNLANTSTYHTKMTNEKFIEDIINKLEDFNINISLTINPQAKDMSPEEIIIMNKIYKARLALEGLIEALQKIKV